MKWRIIADCRIVLRNTKVCTTRNTMALPTHMILEKILLAICPTPFSDKGGAFGANYPTAVRQPGCLLSKEALRLCAPPCDGVAFIAAHGYTCLQPLLKTY